jgi:hypothetical protein
VLVRSSLARAVVVPASQAQIDGKGETHCAHFDRDRHGCRDSRTKCAAAYGLLEAVWQRWELLCSGLTVLDALAVAGWAAVTVGDVLAADSPVPGYDQRQLGGVTIRDDPVSQASRHSLDNLELS